MTYSGDRERQLQLARDHERDARIRQRRTAAEAIRRRLVAHLAAGGTTDFATGMLENDPACYTDRARADLERQELFLKLPLVAGLSCDVPSAGDCLVFEDAGPSILIVRGADGMVRGFLNMCMHRASKLVAAPTDGTCAHHTRLSCPFHAWTYDLSGALVGVPGRAGFDGLDPGARHLVPVPVAEWNGIIFVRAAAGSEPPGIPAFLGSFAGELQHIDFADAAPIRHSRLAADCNWKVALDTYAEGYHFATLHASSIGVSHYSNVAVFDEFGPHWRMNFPEKELRALVNVPESEWPEVAYGGIHFVFPNTVMVVGALGEGRAFVRMFRLFPGETSGTMSCRIDVYDIGGQADERRLAVFGQDDAESSVTREDYQIAVDGYRNLVSAPPGFRLVYGRNEPALQSVHRHIAAALGTSL